MIAKFCARLVRASATEPDKDGNLPKAVVFYGPDQSMLARVAVTWIDAHPGEVRPGDRFEIVEFAETIVRTIPAFKLPPDPSPEAGQ